MSDPLEERTQLCGFWINIASCKGYELPLLSTVCFAPLAMFRVKVKDDIPLEVGIARSIGNHLRVVSAPISGG